MTGTPAGKPAREDDVGKFALVAAGMAVTLLAAFGFGALLGAPPLARFRAAAAGALIGVAAAVPLALVLEWFMRARAPTIAAFREAQIGFFAGIGFEFTPARIAILSLGAGVSEEMLFRGVFQVAAEPLMPMAFAIILPNVLFGMLHWRSAAYAAIAGLVGVYFGLLLLWTGNLLAPILAHAAYDAVALWRTRQAIAARRLSRASPGRAARA